MKKVLIIDACVRREESRTRRMLDRAEDTLKALHPDWEFETLTLMDMDLKYWNTESLKERDELLMQKQYDAPVFALGRQFQQADGVIVAAPFWDLTFPAVLKVYIENISAESITFKSTPNGLVGICQAKWLLFLATRGGIWEEGMELGSPYMEALSKFFGIEQYYCAAADGIDIAELDSEKILEDALAETERICRSLEL